MIQFKWFELCRYAAVTQVFFSLNIFFGSIVNYSSYNKFKYNIYRDANIITTLDTFTSLLAGCCTFAIIGNLAHELGVEDFSAVVRSGPGLGKVFDIFLETFFKQNV